MSRDGAKPMVELARHVRAGILTHTPLGAVKTLLVLAAHANAKGETWPSARTISRMAGRKRTKVYGDVKVLVELGLIEPLGQQKGKATVFRIAPFDPDRPLEETEAGVPAEGTGKTREGVPTEGTSTLFERVPPGGTPDGATCPPSGTEGVPEKGTGVSPFRDRGCTPFGTTPDPPGGTQKWFERERKGGSEGGVQGGGSDSPSREKPEEQRRKNLQGIRGLIQSIEERQCQERVGSA